MPDTDQRLDNQNLINSTKKLIKAIDDFNEATYRMLVNHGTWTDEYLKQIKKANKKSLKFKERLEKLIE